MITFGVPLFFLTDFIYVLVTKWVQIKYFKTEEPILLTFCYKVDINQVHLNRRTDWDPNPKVHQIVPVL